MEEGFRLANGILLATLIPFQFTIFGESTNRPANHPRLTDATPVAQCQLCESLSEIGTWKESVLGISKSEWETNALSQCCQIAKIDPFLSLDCAARVEGVGAQSNFAIWQPWMRVPHKQM